MADFNNLLAELEEFEFIKSHKYQDDSPLDNYVSLDVKESFDKPESAKIANNSDSNNYDENITSSNLSSYSDLDIEYNDFKDLNGFNKEYEKLKQMWVNEINSPEILHCDFEVISLFMELLHEQDNTVGILKKNRNISDRECHQDLMSLAKSICKMDADRLRFILCDLIRLRIAKLEKYVLHNRSMLNRLGDHEISYLKQYGELFERHMKMSVTSNFPIEEWQNLDDPEMVNRPDLDIYVFCNVLDDVQIDNRHTNISDYEDEDANQIQNYGSGTTLFLRYHVVQKFVQSGKVELLIKTEILKLILITTKVKSTQRKIICLIIEIYQITG